MDFRTFLAFALPIAAGFILIGLYRNRRRSLKEEASAPKKDDKKVKTFMDIFNDVKQNPMIALPAGLAVAVLLFIDIFLFRYYPGFWGWLWDLRFIAVLCLVAIIGAHAAILITAYNSLKNKPIGTAYSAMLTYFLFFFIAVNIVRTFGPYVEIYTMGVERIDNSRNHYEPVGSIPVVNVTKEGEYEYSALIPANQECVQLNVSLKKGQVIRLLECKPVNIRFDPVVLEGSRSEQILPVGAYGMVESVAGNGTVQYLPVTKLARYSSWEKRHAKDRSELTKNDDSFYGAPMFIVNNRARLVLVNGYSPKSEQDQPICVGLNLIRGEGHAGASGFYKVHFTAN